MTHWTVKHIMKTPSFLGTKNKRQIETNASLIYFVVKLMKSTWPYVGSDDSLGG